MRYVKVTFRLRGYGNCTEFYDRESPSDLETWSKNEKDLRWPTLNILPATKEEYNAAHK
jgi:hypothetical protein